MIGIAPYYFTSKIEIKPQPRRNPRPAIRIILHQRSKSNHNQRVKDSCKRWIILHQRSKSNHNPWLWCYSWRVDYFTSKIEIKPQLRALLIAPLFHYFTSKIEIKPQLVECSTEIFDYYFTSKIEIKPQLRKLFHVVNDDYFTSKIEIKPQQAQPVGFSQSIILHQRSKSNHNKHVRDAVRAVIILHQRSKSNHNYHLHLHSYRIIILHQRSKSNHNLYPL